MDRNEVIKIIRENLKRRSGKAWSVTGGTGTAYGWIKIDAPPKRRTWKIIQTRDHMPPEPGAIYRGANGITPNHVKPTNYSEDPWAQEAVESGREVYFNWEVNDPSYDFGHMGPDDRKELAALLDKPYVHTDGVSVPSSGAYYEEYIARAKGEKPTRYGEQYWD